MGLETYGWLPFFESHFSDYRTRGMIAGRVIRSQRDVLTLHTEKGEIEGHVAGRLRHQATTGVDELPVVGDWVALRGPASGERRAVIAAVLPRRTRLSRKVAGASSREQVIAANVDTVVLVMGLDGDFNLRRLERLVTMAWESGAQPVVVLNKVDLCPRPDEQVARVAAVAPGVEVRAMSCATGLGVESLQSWLVAGRTLVLVGSSGVGKSTLTNLLAASDLMATGSVRASDDRGRHTTTHRQLVRLPSGALLIDNPGIRELQLWADDGALSETFEDIESIAASCRFRDCSHAGEPGCAVGAAIAAGDVTAERLRSYAKLMREMRYLELRCDEAAQRQEKKKEAALHRAMKSFKKTRR